jgi:uncharacterized membrane protein
MTVRFLSPLALILWVSSVPLAVAQNRVEVDSAVRQDVSQPLRNIQPVQSQQSAYIKPVMSTMPATAAPTEPDAVLQTQTGASSTPLTALNFDGVGNGFAGPQGPFSVTAAVPNAHGAVGANQYVQWVNTSFAVFDKATGAPVYGPVPGNSLWAGFGGECENTNYGDPIVQYDKAAGRWVMTQFAGNGLAPFFQCVAVSTTSDATGQYYRYAFTQPYFNDYAKLGVWPDAYYVTFNMFNGGNTFVGARACAWDRAKMLVGAQATQQCIQFLSSVDSLVPSDLDGSTPPPPGSPNYVMTYITSPSNYLKLWKFQVDFVNTANTRMIGPYSLATQSFSEACLGCIPQLGSTQLLDSVGDRLMFRAAYRNFGDHEAVVVNHSISTGNAVGVRWYELRDLSQYPTLYQQGTYAPDSNYRWMGSIAMDQAGNAALGYSMTSSTMNPSIAYTGRTPSDPLGTMGTENVIMYGSGSQTQTPRWGEYTSMSIDPVDDCTFWYTNQYLRNTGTFNWSTRIANFRFPNCGPAPSPDFVLSATPSSNTVNQGSAANYSVNVSSLNGFSGNVALSVSGLPAGATYSFVPTSITGSGTSAMTITTGSSTPAGNYVLTIRGISGSLDHSTPVTLSVAVPIPDFTLNVTPAVNTVVQGSFTTYTVTVSSLNGFDGIVDLSLSALPSGTFYSFTPGSIAGSGSSTLTIATSSSTPVGTTYPLTITGTSGNIVRSKAVTFVVAPVPDFAITATPSAGNVTQGSGTTYTIAVSALNGFTGNVNLWLSGLPAGTAYSFSPSAIAGSGNSTLTITTSNSTPLGTHSLTIIGTSGNLLRSTTVSLVVVIGADFSLTTTPSSQSISQGSGASYTVSVSALQGFTGKVDLWLGGLPPGASYNFSTASITGSGTSNLTITTTSATPVGTYTVTITGTSGSLLHSAAVTLVVSAPPPPSFAVTVSPTSRTIYRGAATSYNVTITPSNGFNGVVSFSVTGLPNATTASFTPSSVTGSGSSVLYVDTGNSTTRTTYTLTVRATGGGVTQTKTVTLTVR